MTHEFKVLVNQANKNLQNALKSALVTVVFLEGSSYRKPGVRMLISEDLKMTGAVSGGCVEAEIKRRAITVFKDNISKVITYDGRYRLGCEGVLYILIEPFNVSDAFLEAFNLAIEGRQEFKIDSYFTRKDNATGNFGSVIYFKNQSQYSFNTFDITKTEELQLFSQTLTPSINLLIIGAEHDAVKLCEMANFLGWEVNVVSSIKNPKKLSDFPGAKSITAQSPETINLKIDAQTIIVLMTHNYAIDLIYLLKIADLRVKYIGILGSKKRKNQLLDKLLEYKEDITEAFLSTIHSPAGLPIGAITPEEIALSIIAEILSILRESEPVCLDSISKKATL